MRIPLAIFAAAVMAGTTVAGARAQDDCGAGGDGCAPADYQKLLEVAAAAFPDWPEVGYRTYAGLCYEASGELRRLCLDDPQQAAKALKLPPDDE